MKSGAITGAVDRRHMTGIATLAASAALAAALVVGACGSDPSPSGTDAAAAGPPTLSAISSEIFNETCALGSCHGAPTLAAGLDLRRNDLCHSLLRRSCLFPSKVLVLPGKPEESFLLDKLRGTGLEGTPDPACATSNERMPSDRPLSDGKIAQIAAWIQNGADCSDVPPVDAGIDVPAEPLADVASVSAVTTMLQVGQQTQMTVTLTHGAPSPMGQLIIVDFVNPDDSAILEVMNADVGPGVSSATIDVRGRMVGSATLAISSGTNSQSIPFTVTSLTLSDGKTATMQLGGTIPGTRPPRD